MNTADEQYSSRRANTTRDGNSVDKVRRSTELASSRSSKARIKVISTKLPDDFFHDVKIKLDVNRSGKWGQRSEVDTQPTTPKFSNRSSFHELKLSNFLTESRKLIQGDRQSYDEEKVQALRKYSDPASRPLKIRHSLSRRPSNNEQRICSYIKDVIQLSTSLKKKDGPQGKRINFQLKGSIFNRENFELPPLLERNTVQLPVHH